MHTAIIIIMILILLAIIAPKAVKGIIFLALTAFGTLFAIVVLGYLAS